MRLALVLVACLGVAACGGPSHAPAVAPSAQPSATQSPAVRFLNEAVSLAHVDNLRMRPAVSTTMSGGRSLGVLSVTPDGLLVAVINDAPQRGPDPGITQCRLELVDPSGGRVDIPGRNGAQPRQAVYADADNRYVVWMETPSTQAGVSDWVLLAYDRQSKRTHVVDRAKAGQDSSANAPTLAAGRVWWSVVEFTGDEDHPAKTNLYSHSLTNDQPARLEVNASTGGVVTDDAMFYVAESTATPSPTGGRATIYRRDLATGSDTVFDTVDLGPEETLHSLTAAGGDLGWVVGYNDRDASTTSKVMLRHADGTRTIIDGGALALGVDALTPDLLAWIDGGDNGGEWILDRHQDRVVHLSSQPGLAEIKAEGNHLAWREGSSWQVADLL